MPYRHVLVVCNDSYGADAAVLEAARLALRDRARLTVAAVAELERPGRGCQFGVSVWNGVLRDAAEADLERARKVVQSPAHFTVLKGEFSRAVAEAVGDLGCDAIMVAPRPRHRLTRILTRDRAKAVRRRTGCPVLQPR